MANRKVSSIRTCGEITYNSKKDYSNIQARKSNRPMCDKHGNDVECLENYKPLIVNNNKEYILFYSLEKLIIRAVCVPVDIEKQIEERKAKGIKSSPDFKQTAFKDPVQTDIIKALLLKNNNLKSHRLYADIENNIFKLFCEFNINNKIFKCRVENLETNYKKSFLKYLNAGMSIEQALNEINQKVSNSVISLNYKKKDGNDLFFGEAIQPTIISSLKK